MCCIYGIFSKKKPSGELTALSRNALNLTKYRGPDKTEIVTSKNFSCGVNRLAIESLKFGSQPIEDERYIAGFNGEIFNYKDLIKEFKLPNIKSEIQLILCLWKEKKENFISLMQGQFAIFIFDKLREDIFLFRDPFGIRPVFYSIFENQFIFCSEIKGIIRSNLEGYCIDEKSIAQTCMFWTNIGTQTSFKNIFSLPSGHYLKWNLNKKILKRHYIFPTLKKKINNFEDVSLKAILERAVKNQIHGEVEYGCYLSGGIDSSILASLLSKEKRIKTFSISFDHDEYDESYFQNLMSKKINSEHYNLIINEKMIADNFEKTVYHAETLLFRTAPVPMYLLSKLVKENNIKVVYSGEGADEILFGYDIFFENRIRKFWKKNPNSLIRPQLLKKLYGYLPQFKNSRYFSIIKDFYNSTLEEESIFYSHLVRWSQFKHVSSFFNLSKENENEENILSDFKKTLPDGYKFLNDDNKNQYIEINTLLSNYLLSSQGDRMSMANSVEGRFPYLDENLVLFATSAGCKKLAPNLDAKKMLKNSFKNIIPRDILDRPKVAYQAPEARSFVNETFTSKIVEDIMDNIHYLPYVNEKNFLNLISKLKDPYSSKRVGFRENMAFIIILSYFSLNKAAIDWKHG
jgi:asparagine synthase (glutamine-hydrolysing)